MSELFTIDNDDDRDHEVSRKFPLLGVYKYNIYSLSKPYTRNVFQNVHKILVKELNMSVFIMIKKNIYSLEFEKL